MPPKRRKVVTPEITQELLVHAWQTFLKVLESERKNIEWSEKIPRNKIKRIASKVKKLRALCAGLSDKESSCFPLQLFASEDLPSADSLLPPDPKHKTQIKKIVRRLDAALTWLEEYESLCKVAASDRKTKWAEKALTSELLEYWWDKTGQRPKGRKDAFHSKPPLNVWLGKVHKKLQEYGNIQEKTSLCEKALKRLNGYSVDDMIVAVSALL